MESSQSRIAQAMPGQDSPQTRRETEEEARNHAEHQLTSEWFDRTRTELDDVAHRIAHIEAAQQENADALQTLHMRRIAMEAALASAESQAGAKVINRPSSI